LSLAERLLVVEEEEEQVRDDLTASELNEFNDSHTFDISM